MDIKKIKREMTILVVPVVMTLACWPSVSRAQLKKQVLTHQTELGVVNRKVELLQQEGRTVIHADARPGNGIIWINESHFSTGVIEADLKGEDILQQSFVGIAFDGSNDSTYQAVYFRPFNFRSEDPVRRRHAVQYISLPSLDWSFLREKFPGKYENCLNNPPDPDGWFHIKIIVNTRKVEVFAGSNKKPSLAVQRLPGKGVGKLGLWVGNNSEGDFSNLTIINKKFK